MARIAGLHRAADGFPPKNYGKQTLNRSITTCALRKLLEFWSKLIIAAATQHQEELVDELVKNRHSVPKRPDECDQ